jgi:hypothetical protein
MPSLYAICEWLEKTSMGVSIRNTLWQFQLIETIHIFGIVAVMGATSILDLRLMNLAFKDIPVSKLAGKYTLPWTWIGFAVMLVTGFLMITAEATKLITDIAFQIKMLLLLAAGLNALAFDRLAYRNVKTWDTAPTTPIAAKIAGALSIMIWLVVVVAGRWIAYVF